MNQYTKTISSEVDPSNEHGEKRTTTIDVETALKAGASTKGAWNRAQLAVLGVSWPPQKGWKAELVRQGHRLSPEDYELFVSLRTRPAHQ